MDAIAPTLASVSSTSDVPISVRAILWTGVVAAGLFALTIGVMMIAGNNAKDAKLWRMFLIAVGVGLLVQGGYLLAPFAVGKSWWAWAFWAMAPLAVLIIATAMTPVIGAIKWTRPDGASGWKTIAEMGWVSLIGVVVYVTPPVLVWMYRPASGATVADAATTVP